MPIEDRNLSAGTKLVGRYKGQPYRAEVMETGDGPRYRLEDGREFKSPSSAGSAVMGGVSCNGWRFWSIETEESRYAAKPKETAQKEAKTPAKPA